MPEVVIRFCLIKVLALLSASERINWFLQLWHLDCRANKETVDETKRITFHLLLKQKYIRGLLLLWLILCYYSIMHLNIFPNVFLRKQSMSIHMAIRKKNVHKNKQYSFLVLQNLDRYINFHTDCAFKCRLLPTVCGSSAYIKHTSIWQIVPWSRNFLWQFCLYWQFASNFLLCLA